MLECSIGNSKSQLHKARMKLRDLLRTGQSTNRASVRPCYERRRQEQRIHENNGQSTNPQPARSFRISCRSSSNPEPP